MARDTEQEPIPVKVKAVVVDPASMTVAWMNEAALQDVPDLADDFVPGAPVGQAVPMAEMLGLPDALHAVAGTGVPRHLQANLVSTSRGSVTIATSVYRLPEGTLLVLTENAWQPAHGKADGAAQRRSSRRTR